MSPINATLLIQVGNFVFAWKVLDRFLLKECVQEVRSDDHMIASLQESVLIGQMLLRKAEEEQVRVVTEIREQFATALPPVSCNLVLKSAPIDQFLVGKECDVAMCKKTADAVVAMVVKRIMHV